MYFIRKERDEMKIIFGDATTLEVQSVTENGDHLMIKTTKSSPEELRAIFSDPVKTRTLTVEERGKKTVYEGYTEFYRTEEYTGKIYGIVNYKPEKTPEAKEEVVTASVMVAQIQAQSLTDQQALTVKAIYPKWDGNGVAYTAGYKVLENDVLYKCLQDHTSQADWNPSAAPSIWTEVLIPDPEVIPEWEQPESTNGYAAGDKVTHNGVVYESLVDNNVWEPGVEGTEALWIEITS